MDLIQRAQAKREWHRTELARLEAFLATAFELEQDMAADHGKIDRRSDAVKADVPVKRRVSRLRGGVGAETVAAAEEIISVRGPMATRDLLPLVRARGIDVGGNDPVATLSARISNKSNLVSHYGKWCFVEEDVLASETDTGQKETADNPATDRSAVSLFNANQGGQDGTALAD